MQVGTWIYVYIHLFFSLFSKYIYGFASQVRQPYLQPVKTASAPSSFWKRAFNRVQQWHSTSPMPLLEPHSSPVRSLTPSLSLHPSCPKFSPASPDPSSEKASSIKKTLAKCEANALPGEIKCCATSLESMVDFAMSGLKSSNIHAMSTSVAKAATPKQIHHHRLEQGDHYSIK